jgi:hypothetical protein
VYQVERGALVRPGDVLFGEDGLSAGRLTDGAEPLFPLARGLRLVVGVQQQTMAQRAAAALRQQ